jgi:hypothetical protein
MPIFSKYWQATIEGAVAGIFMHTRSLLERKLHDRARNNKDITYCGMPFALKRETRFLAC